MAPYQCGPESFPEPEDSGDDVDVHMAEARENFM